VERLNAKRLAPTLVSAQFAKFKAGALLVFTAPAFVIARQILQEVFFGSTILTKVGGQLAFKVVIPVLFYPIVVLLKA
jgi:hypothetical protein